VPKAHPDTVEDDGYDEAETATAKKTKVFKTDDTKLDQPIKGEPSDNEEDPLGLSLQGSPFPFHGSVGLDPYEEV
jgi:hypothetical protein